MKNKINENIESSNRNIINEFLNEKINLVREQPHYLIRLISTPLILLSLIVTSELLDLFNNLFWCLSITYIVFSFGYEVDKRFKILGHVFFLLRLISGIYIGYSFSLSLYFLGIKSGYKFDDFFNPSIMIKEYSPDRTFLIFGCMGGALSVVFLDLIITTYKNSQKLFPN